MNYKINIKHLVQIAKCERFIKRLKLIKKDINKGIQSKISFAATKDAVLDFEKYSIKMNYHRKNDFDDERTINEVFQNKSDLEKQINELETIIKKVDIEIEHLDKKIAYLNNCKLLVN